MYTEKDSFYKKLAVIKMDVTAYKMQLENLRADVERENDWIEKKIDAMNQQWRLAISRAEKKAALKMKLKELETKDPYGSVLNKEVKKNASD